MVDMSQDLETALQGAGLGGRPIQLETRSDPRNQERGIVGPPFFWYFGHTPRYE